LAQLWTAGVASGRRSCFAQRGGTRHACHAGITACGLTVHPPAAGPPWACVHVCACRWLLRCQWTSCRARTTPRTWRCRSSPCTGARQAHALGGPAPVPSAHHSHHHRPVAPAVRAFGLQHRSRTGFEHWDMACAWLVLEAGRARRPGHRWRHIILGASKRGQGRSNRRAGRGCSRGVPCRRAAGAAHRPQVPVPGLQHLRLVRAWQQPARVRG
jgi:hypothetical protein